jgi:hypothetical protein
MCACLFGSSKLILSIYKHFAEGCDSQDDFFVRNPLTHCLQPDGSAVHF